MSQFRLRAGLTVRGLPDGDAVVATADGADAIIINASAYAVVELLDEPRSDTEIASVFARLFPDQDASAISRDVTQLVQELVKAGIVEACGSASSTA